MLLIDMISMVRVAANWLEAKCTCMSQEGRGKGMMGETWLPHARQNQGCEQWNV